MPEKPRKIGDLPTLPIDWRGKQPAKFRDWGTTELFWNGPLPEKNIKVYDTMDDAIKAHNQAHPGTPHMVFKHPNQPGYTLEFVQPGPQFPDNWGLMLLNVHQFDNLPVQKVDPKVLTTRTVVETRGGSFFKAAGNFPGTSLWIHKEDLRTHITALRAHCGIGEGVPLSSVVESIKDGLPQDPEGELNFRILANKHRVSPSMIFQQRYKPDTDPNTIIGEFLHAHKADYYHIELLQLAKAAAKGKDSDDPAKALVAFFKQGIWDPLVNEIRKIEKGISPSPGDIEIAYWSHGQIAAEIQRALKAPHPSMVPDIVRDLGKYPMSLSEFALTLWPNANILSKDEVLKSAWGLVSETAFPALTSIFYDDAYTAWEKQLYPEDNRLVSPPPTAQTIMAAQIYFIAAWSEIQAGFLPLYGQYLIDLFNFQGEFDINAWIKRLIEITWPILEANAMCFLQRKRRDSQDTELPEAPTITSEMIKQYWGIFHRIYSDPPDAKEKVNENINQAYFERYLTRLMFAVRGLYLKQKNARSDEDSSPITDLLHRAALFLLAHPDYTFPEPKAPAKKKGSQKESGASEIPAAFAKEIEKYMKEIRATQGRLLEGVRYVRDYFLKDEPLKLKFKQGDSDRQKAASLAIYITSQAILTQFGEEDGAGFPAKVALFAEGCLGQTISSVNGLVSLPKVPDDQKQKKNVSKKTSKDTKKSVKSKTKQQTESNTASYAAEETVFMAKKAAPAAQPNAQETPPAQDVTSAPPELETAGPSPPLNVNTEPTLIYAAATDFMLDHGLYAPLFTAPPLGIAPVRYSVEHRTMRLNFGHLGRPAKATSKKSQTRKDRIQQIRDLLKNDPAFVQQYYLTECLSHLAPPPKEGPSAGKYSTKRLKIAPVVDALKAVDPSAPIPDMDFATFKALSLDLLNSLENFSTKKPTDATIISDGYALGKKLGDLSKSRGQFQITPFFSSLLARVMRLIVGSCAYRGTKKDQVFNPADLAEKLKSFWKDVVAVYAAAFASTFQVSDARGSFIAREYKTLQKRIETEARLLQFKLNKLMGEKLYTLTADQSKPFMTIFDPSVLPPLSALTPQLPPLTLPAEPPATIDKKFSKFQNFLELAERQPREETFIQWQQAQAGIVEKIKALVNKTRAVRSSAGSARGKTSTMKFGMNTPQTLSDTDFTLAGVAGAFISLLKQQCPAGELNRDSFTERGFQKYFHAATPFRWWGVYRRVSLSLARLMMVYIGKAYANSAYATQMLDYYHFSGFYDAMADFQSHIRAFDANMSRFLALDEEIAAQIQAFDAPFLAKIATNKNLIWNNLLFKQLALVPLEESHFSPLIASPMVKSVRSAFAYLHQYFSQIEAHLRTIKSWALSLAAVCMNNNVTEPQAHIANLFNAAERLMRCFGEFAKKPTITFATSAESTKIILDATGMASLLDFSPLADGPKNSPPMNKFKYAADKLPVTNLVHAAIWVLQWDLPQEFRDKIRTAAENFDKFNYIDKIAAEIQAIRKKLFYFVWRTVPDPSDGDKVIVEKQTVFPTTISLEQLPEYCVSFRNLCGDPRFLPLFDIDEAGISSVVIHKVYNDAGLAVPDEAQRGKLGLLKYLRRLWFAEFRVMKFYQTLTSPLSISGKSATAIAKSVATRATGALLGQPIRDLINQIPQEAVQYWTKFHNVSTRPAPAGSLTALGGGDTLDAILNSGDPAKLGQLVKRVTFWNAGGSMVEEPDVFNQLAKFNKETETINKQKVTRFTLTRGVTDYAEQQHKTMSLALAAVKVLQDKNMYFITAPEKYVNRIKENLAAWRESGRLATFKPEDFATIQIKTIENSLKIISPNDFVDLMPLIDQAQTIITNSAAAGSGGAESLEDNTGEEDEDGEESVESLMDEEESQAKATAAPPSVSDATGLTASDLNNFIRNASPSADDIRGISQKINNFLAIAPQTIKILAFLSSPVSSGTSTYFEVCAKKVMLNKSATIPEYHEKVLQFTTRSDKDRLFLIKAPHKAKSHIIHYYFVYKILLDNGTFMVLCDRVKHKPNSDFPLFSKLKLLFECLHKDQYWTNFNNYRAPLSFALQKFCSMVDDHAKITQLFLPSEKNFYNYPISWFNFTSAKGLLRQARDLFIEFWGELQGEPNANELQSRFQEIMTLIDTMVMEPKPYRKTDSGDKRYGFYRDLQQLLRVLFLTAESQHPIDLAEKEFGVSASDFAADNITIPLEESETVLAAFKVVKESSIFYHIKRFSQSPKLRDSLISACGQLAFISAVHYLRITALSYADKYQLDLSNVSVKGKQVSMWDLPLTQFVRQFLALRATSSKLDDALASPRQEASLRGTFATALTHFQFIFHELAYGLKEGRKPLNKQYKIFSDFLDTQKFQIMPDGKILGMFSWKDIVPKFLSGYPAVLVASNDLGLRDPSTPAESSELLKENERFHKNRINLVQEFAKECQPASPTILKKAGDQQSPMRAVARANYILRQGLSIGFAKQRRRNWVAGQLAYFGRYGVSQSRARHMLRLGNTSTQMARRQLNANITYGHILAKATVDHARFALWNLFTQGSPTPPSLLADFDYAAPPLAGTLPTSFKDSLGVINGRFNAEKDIKEWAAIFGDMPARVLNSLAKLNFENLRNYRGGGLSFALQKNSWLRGKFLQYAEETAALRGVHANTYVPPAYTSKKAFETGQEGVLGYLAVQTEDVVFRSARDASMSGPQFLVIDELNTAHQGGRLFDAVMKIRSAVNTVISPAGFPTFDAFEAACRAAIRALAPTAPTLFPDGEWTEVVNWDLTRRHHTRLKIHADNMEKKIKEFQRRHAKGVLTSQSLALITALLSQIGFIVWGAATIYKVLKFFLNSKKIEKKNFNVIFMPARDGNQISYYTGQSLLAKLGIGASASKVDESIINSVGDIAQNLDFTSLYGILSTALCYSLGAAGGVTSKIKDKDDNFNSDDLFFLGRDPNASANIGGYNAFTTTGENLVLNMTRLKAVIDPDEPERGHNQTFLRNGLGKLFQHLVKATQLYLGETRFQDKSFLYDALTKRERKALGAILQEILPYLPAMPRTSIAASLMFPDVVQEFQRALPSTFDSEAAFPDNSSGLPDAIPQLYVMFWQWIANISANQTLMNAPVPPMARLRQLLLPPSINIKPLKDYWATPESHIGITDWAADDNSPIPLETLFTGALQPLGPTVSANLQANNITLTKNHLIDFVKSFGDQIEIPWKDLKGAFLGTIQRDKAVDLGEIFAFMAAYLTWG